MVNEADDHIEEVPASHKKQFQRVMVGVAIGLIVLLVGLFWASASGKKQRALAAQQKLEQQQEREERERALKGPKATDAEKFQRDMEARRQSMLKQIEAAERSGKLPDDPQLRASIEKLKNSPVTGEEPRQAGRNANTNNRGSERDPVADWQLKEKLRALDSSRRPYGLSGRNGSASAEASAPHASQAGFDAGPEIDTRASLSEQQRQVQQKIAAMQRLKTQLAGANGDPEQVAQLVSGRGTAAQPRSGSPADVVGFTASKAADYNDSTAGKILVPTGTVINAVLAQQLISDYPGSFKGMLTHDVYDADYERILFPKGTTVVGKVVRIANVNAPISSRMGLTVNWFVLPNGQRIDMSKKAGAQDHAGVGAIGGDVNYHFLAQFLGVAAYAILVSESDQRSSPYTGEVNVEGDIQRSMAEQFSPVVQKYLNLVPTITLPIGTPFKVFIEDDLYVKPYGSIYDRLISAH